MRAGNYGGIPTGFVPLGFDTPQTGILCVTCNHGRARPVGFD